MSESARQIISFTGATVGLFAFAMLQAERPGWGAKDAKYLVLCVIAGVLLSWMALVDRNYGFLFLNVAFTGFALSGLGQRILAGIWRM